MENREENWMEKYLLNSPLYVLKIDKEGTVLYANERGRSLMKVLKSGVVEISPIELQDTLQEQIYGRNPRRLSRI